MPPLFQIFWYSGMFAGITIFVYITLEWIAPELKQEIKAFINKTIPQGIEDYKQWKKKRW